MNALKHGLTAAEIILPTVEEKIDFEQFRFAFIDECQPVGLIEALLVEDMVTARWRMNRARKMEPGFFAYRQADLKSRMEYFAALDAQAHLAFIMCDDAQNSDTLGKISRYEARFERTFYKALKELQRLQALRAEVSDSGNGTVSPTPISPDSEPVSDPIPDPPQPQASARGTAEPPPQPTTQASARVTDPAVAADIDPAAA
jgi:hypothetical protein